MCIKALPNVTEEKLDQLQKMVELVIELHERPVEVVLKLKKFYF